MHIETIYRMTEDGLLTQVSEIAGSLAVAGSFLVSDGQVRAPKLHLNRFAASCLRFNVPSESVVAFWRAACPLFEKPGNLFPRFELSACNSRYVLQVRVRYAPPLKTHAIVLGRAFKDSRIYPRHKGPDLEMLLQLRSKVNAESADEALLVSPFGAIREAITSSVAWWERETLCFPDPKMRILPGVTARVLQTAASHRGSEIRFVQRKLDEIKHCEIWILNALHGIRSINFVGDEERAPTERVILWRKRIDQHIVPFSERSLA